MAAARGAAFTAAVRVIDRVLGHTAGQRLDAHPPLAPSLGEVLVLVVGVRNRTDRAHAVTAHIALFARVQANDHHPTVTADQLDVSPGRPANLPALARLHLDLVPDPADRQLRPQHGFSTIGAGPPT